VEYKEQFELLAELDCDVMLGYYFDRPLRADDLTTLLQGGDLLPEATDFEDEPVEFGRTGMLPLYEHSPA